MTRHKWNYEKKPGYAICDNCGLDVKAWRVKEGGLAECKPENLFKRDYIDCSPDMHMRAAVAGSRICWNCGAPYTKEEREAGQKIMDKMVSDGANPVLK